jgi:tetratricopeptide (TPR) repeat protein
MRNIANLAPKLAFVRAEPARLIRIALLFALALAPYADATGPAAVIGGVVQDIVGTPVVGASVSLATERGTPIQTVSSDAHGAFRFVLEGGDKYTIGAKIAGYQKALITFTLERGEEKHITLTLKPAQASGSVSKSSSLPEFSDQPNFTVAGVTDTTNLGGHGSDVVVRNREGLARATAALAEPSPSQSPEFLAATEKSLRAALEKDRASYDANYRLGKLLLEEGKPREAIPYLEGASKTDSHTYESEYQLALAHCAVGELQTAAAEANTLLSRNDTAEVHHLLAEVAEKRSDPLEAVRQYQRATELVPTEQNYFDWGSELLMHQAAEPAVEVFSRGRRLVPASVRMLSALGAAWYAQGVYDQAVETLCQASDLDPAAASAYMFLGRIQSVEAAANAEIVARLARFAQLQPASPWANYYYAVSLWKQRKSSDDNQNLPKIETLLQTAIRIDPDFAAANLQLGALYSEQKNLLAAIAAYQKASQSAPDLPDAHYRLAQLYRQADEKSKAQQELQLYRQTSQKAAEETERERHDVRQFVYTLRGQPATRPQ